MRRWGALVLFCLLVFVPVRAWAPEEAPFFVGEIFFPNALIVFDNSDSMQDVPYLNPGGIAVRPDHRRRTLPLFVPPRGERGAQRRLCVIARHFDRRVCRPKAATIVIFHGQARAVAQGVVFPGCVGRQARQEPPAVHEQPGAESDRLLRPDLQVGLCGAPLPQKRVSVSDDARVLAPRVPVRFGQAGAKRVERVPAHVRGPFDQLEVVRPEDDGVLFPDDVAAASLLDPVDVQAPPALCAQPFLHDERSVLPCESQTDDCVVAPPLDDVFDPSLPEGPPAYHEVDRFEDVGLPRAVRPDEHGRLVERPDLEVPVVPEPFECDARDRHVLAHPRRTGMSRYVYFMPSVDLMTPGFIGLMMSIVTFSESAPAMPSARYA